MNHCPHFTIEEIDPRAKLMVAVYSSLDNEFGLTNGERIREKWEDQDLKRISSTTPGREGWFRCLVPDGRHLLIKFLSKDFQLMMVEDDSIERDTNMPTTVKRKAPPKKSAIKPAAAAKSASTSSSEKPTKPAAPKVGGYPYMLNRIKAQLLKKKTGAENRSQIRTGIEPLETYSAVRAFAIKSTVVKDGDDWDKFMNELVAEAVSGGKAA
jgi:hypothetical protein